jgi:hypothetical protein
MLYQCIVVVAARVPAFEQYVSDISFRRKPNDVESRQRVGFNRAFDKKA